MDRKIHELNYFIEIDGFFFLAGDEFLFRLKAIKADFSILR